MRLKRFLLDQLDGIAAELVLSGAQLDPSGLFWIRVGRRLGALSANLHSRWFPDAMDQGRRP